MINIENILNFCHLIHLNLIKSNVLNYIDDILRKCILVKKKVLDNIILMNFVKI